MSFKDSRYIAMFEVPDAQRVSAKFVYNFFVTDERVNASGKRSFQGLKAVDSVIRNGDNVAHGPGGSAYQPQKGIDPRVLELSLPRYIEINFDETIVGSDDIRSLFARTFSSGDAELVQSEETITTERDCSIVMQDSRLTARLRQKAMALAALMGVDSGIGSEGFEAIIERDKAIDADQLEAVMSDSMQPGVEFVNEVGVLYSPPIFSAAADLPIDMMADRRLLEAIFGGDYNKENFKKTELLNLAAKDRLEFLPVASDDSGNRSNEPRMTCVSMEPYSPGRAGGERRQTNLASLTGWADRVKAMTLGYVLRRTEVRADGSKGEDVKYYIDGDSNTRFLDTKVLYGSTYTYTLRTVALVQMTIGSNGEENITPGFYRVISLIASRPSPGRTVLATERIAPREPDGIFYRFDYSAGRGLIIRWQIPVGKQRDVKYFQVFRRKSIYEAFTCIAELDFDDSEVISPRTEKINSDRITKLRGPVTSFADPEFSRASSYIYAVVAVDAHNLSSGYSAQSLVTFNKIENSIDLKSISRAGAPKQYPNFFIDPDLDDNIFVDSLTQDSMQVSKKFSIKIYFDPDAQSYTSNNGQKEPVVVTNENAGIYKLHIMNMDRQKSAIMEMKVRNQRTRPLMIPTTSDVLDIYFSDPW